MAMGKRRRGKAGQDEKSTRSTKGRLFPFLRQTAFGIIVFKEKGKEKKKGK